MKKHQKEFIRSRRDFLRQASCASLGVTGLVNALAHLRLMTAALAQSTPANDYKALVFLFLNGGNDSNNMLVPIGDPASSMARADYELGRGVIGIPRAQLHPLTIPSSTRAFQQHYAGVTQPLGLHPNMPQLANLFNAGKLATFANVGTLAYPVGSRSAYNSGSIPLPSQLFSHSDQQTQWQSSIPDRPFASGWGGRAADLLHSSYNNAASSKVSMSISLAGVNSFQIGTTGNVIQYVIQPSGTVNVDGFGSNYANTIDPNADDAKRFKAFEDIMRLTHANLHEEEHNRIIRRARNTEAVIGAALTSAAASESNLNYNINNIFTAASANHKLGDQLKMIARLIAGRSALGNQRQIYFCQVTGYDTHSSTLNSHGNLMTELATGLQAFHDVLQAMGAWDQVLTCTASDFNRTFTPNGTNAATAGCDHAWGGHAFMMGGAVNGGDIYGHFPLLKTGNVTGSLDAGNGSTNRGRWVPTTSVDQYCSVMARWLGAQSSELAAIFPNLPRFDDPFAISTANANFIKPALL